jgi:glycosyltransferase involved in cell wall biosynthesis
MAMLVSGLRVPVVVHVRDTPQSFVQYGWRSALRRWLYRMSLWWLDAQCVAVSNAAAKHTSQGLQVDRSRMAVVLNGIELSCLETPTEFRVKPQYSPFVVGMAGRLTPEKGQIQLIQAVARLRREGVDIRLKLAGEGSWRSKYEQVAQAEGAGEAVQFLGEVSDIDRFYRSLDVFVLSSLEREGLPRVLLEAMACGVPCVANDCEGVTDVLTDGESGLVVPRGDIAALCKALKLMSSDEVLRQRLSETGRQRVRANFRIERVIDQLFVIYDAILGIGIERSSHGAETVPRAVFLI